MCGKWGGEEAVMSATEERGATQFPTAQLGEPCAVPRVFRMASQQRSNKARVTETISFAGMLAQAG